MQISLFPKRTPQLRSDRWREAGVEPTLNDVLIDPIVRSLMRRDGLTRDDVYAAIEMARMSYLGQAEAADKQSPGPRRDISPGHEAAASPGHGVAPRLR